MPVIFFSLLLSTTVAAAGVQEHQLNTVTVTDVRQRRVEITMPLERIVTINTSSAAILRALGVDIHQKVVGVTSYITANPKFWPELREKPDFHFTSLNYERLAELNPQLIILYKNSNATTDEDKLKSLGIQWVYMDCNDPRTLDNDIRQLGMLFGKEKQAEELIQWYRKYDLLISERIEDIKEENRPRVFYYSFVHTNVPKGIYATKNRQAASHPLIEKAGGVNLGSDLPVEYLEVSAEWIVQNNPDAVIGDVIGKTICGYNAEESEAVQNLAKLYRKLISMVALKNTRAIRSNNILLIAQDLKEGPACIIGTAYIAKFLYPERFPELDPLSIAREYYQKWCRLPYQGVYVYPAIAAAGPATNAAKKESSERSMAIIDGVGRRVDVPVPLKRIVAANGTFGPEMLCAFGVSDRIVGVTDHAAKPTLHLSAFLQNIPTVGKSRQLNTEKVIELSPDAVLLYETFHPYPQSFTDTLDHAGIKMIVMDFHRPEVFEQRMHLLGKLLDRQERAEELIAFEQKQFNRIKNRLKGLVASKLPRVYLESYLDYTTVTPRNPDHELLNTCGGINIFHDLRMANSMAATIAPEAVIERNPDVIIKHISTDHVPNSGYGARDADGLAQVRTAMMRRPGWGKVNAFKSGRIFILDTGTKAAHPSIYSAYIAKWLHPERFEDLHPQELYRQWMQEFLSMAFKGVYAYPIEPVD